MPHRDFLIVVEDSLYQPLQSSLEKHAETMRLANIDVHIEPWAPGTVADLKELLFQQVDLHDIEGALLIGQLPAAWFEQEAFDHREEFPADVYLQDRDATWLDQDGNGIFDYHSELTLDIYTARLIGTEAQLRDYFDRAYYYRRSGPLVDVSAFIFIDDDWSGESLDRLYHLDELYSSVELVQDPSATTSDVYLAKLTGTGAEFVYQWIHANSLSLLLDDLDELGEPTKTWIHDYDIVDENFKASFFNLFDCSAARFTGPNLAERFVVGTDYGLAAIGSTKTGAVADPHWFHESLVLGMRWGEAYQVWYNKAGKDNDEWHLGVVIIGDPLLRLTGDLFPSGYTDASGQSPPGDFYDVMEQIAEEAQLGTFEEYREQHPEFFDD